MWGGQKITESQHPCLNAVAMSSRSVFPCPFKLEGGDIVRKSADEGNTSPRATMGRPRTTDEVAIVLTEAAIGIHGGTDVGALAILGGETVTVPGVCCTHIRILCLV